MHPPTLPKLTPFLLLILPSLTTLTYATPLASPNPSPAILASLSNLLTPIGALLNPITPLRSAPANLLTTHLSPTCAPVNQGALLCCQSMFDGKNPFFVKLTGVFGYQITDEAIIGINCRRSEPGTTTCQNVELCCQIDYLAVTPISDIVSLGLFCQRAPKKPSTPGSPRL